MNEHFIHAKTKEETSQGSAEDVVLLKTGELDLKPPGRLSSTMESTRAAVQQGSETRKNPAPNPPDYRAE